jgi:Lrp/AsnC family transcriptional regulator for asnA, asnC and gidA
MDDQEYQIDNLDRDILHHLQEDARKPFLEIARELGVAGGTIHQRYDKLRENEVILGHRTVLDPKALGYGVLAFVGVHVTQSQDIPEVIDQLRRLSNVVEAHYTTGKYALFLKVYARDMQDYYFFLMKRLQTVKGVRSTETFMCMASPVEREIKVKE